MFEVAGSLERGLAAQRGGRAAAAALAYREVLEREPDQPTALYLCGVLLLADPASAEGEAMLARAATLRPLHCDTRLSLANAYHRRGDTAGAMKLWREVLAIEPGHADASFNCAQGHSAAGDWRQAAECARLALRVHPHHAGLWVTLAGALLQGGVNEAAASAAEAATALQSGCAEAWRLHGTALARQGDAAGAIGPLSRAIMLDPACARAELQLGNAQIDLDCLEKAEPHLRRAIDLDPLLAEAHSSLGFLLSSMARLDEALACHRRALALRPDFAAARSNLASTLLMGGDFARGFAAYEWRKRMPVLAHGCWRSDRPPWQGEKLAGRTILVFCEQGLGDTIFCARFLPVLAEMGAAIVLVCAPALRRLLAGAPGVVAFVPRAEPRSGCQAQQGAAVPPHDTWIDQMSLPLVLGLSEHSIPGAGGYLRADQALAAAWQARLPMGPRIGLVWAGNPEHSNDRRRSMPAAFLDRILAATPATFVSLQVGEDRATPRHVLDAGPALLDMADTAGCLASLDLLIGVDTAVTHLAGALGRPTWLLLPYAAEWRWMTARTDSPWYRSMRLFRQGRPGDWGGVADEVAAALAMHEAHA